MNRLTRYLPLVAIAAVQVLIIAIAPSKSPTELAGVAGPGAGSAETDQTFLGGDDDADPTTTDGDVVDGVTGGTTGSGPGSGSPGSRAGADGVITREEAAVGSKEHCVSGQQFNPKDWAYAPPCIPKFGGNNGDATYRGVTKDTINVVMYDANLGEAVESLLEAQGSNPTPQQMQDFMAAAEKWVNARFELYNRKIKFIYVRGRCQAVPPDYPCLRNEMRQIIQEQNPFFFLWNTSLASPAFDELSRSKVLNAGGWGFRDSFNQQRRPYHWDVLMGGSQQVRQAAEWWCGRMHGHTARYAAPTGNDASRTNPPTNNIQGRTRVLGVISTDDPENKLAVAEFKSHIQSICGARVMQEYYYAQDITTVEQQRREALSAMRGNPANPSDPNDPESTSIMCFCDLVAPIFLYQTCQENRYFPEHIIVGTGFMDADVAAQAYDHTVPPEGHQFENAFGLAQQAKAVNASANTAAKIWQANGGQGYAYLSAEADFGYYGMAASLIQMAGPVLNPLNVEKGASALAFRPGNNTDEYSQQRSFNPAAGDYTWIDNMREAYWSTTQQSPFNDEAGTYITLNRGGRVWFSAGQYPAGELASIPPKPR